MSTTIDGFTAVGSLQEKLQKLLDEKEKQLQMAGTLGQRILAQQMELEERINKISINDTTDEQVDLNPDVMKNLKSLRDKLQSWDQENADVLSSLVAKDVSTKDVLSTVNYYVYRAFCLRSMETTAQSLEHRNKWTW